MPTGEPDINQFAANIIVAAAERAIQAATLPAKTGLRRTIQLVTDAYRPFLYKTYSRVKSIRTFLRPTDSVDLLAHYVPVDLQIGQREIKIDTVIDNLSAGNRYVVSALAGSGKSVLMRFVALTFFHNPKGRIPLFYELRSLNAGGKPSLLHAIHEYYRGNSSIEFSDFERALRNGYFVLILDGFDEISPRERAGYERQILELAREFTNLPIVISGRHDERFNSWEDFSHLSLKAMSLAQTRELIRKSNYDADVVEVFLDRLTEEFFEKHQSFLENPLLAIMLMLTFEGYAEIPETLHEFYRIAFDTLLRRHDAMKSQFLRESHSGCSTEQFKQIFASFCLLTYAKSAFSFDRDRAIAYLKAAITQQGIQKDAEEILFDFIESICLLQQEGFEVSFVHRSFQEYFCAVFISNSASGFVKRYLTEADLRTHDNVLPMLMGIAEQRVESEWAFDKVAELSDQYPISDSGSHLALHLAAFPTFRFLVVSRGAVLIDITDTKLARDLRILQTLYPDEWSEAYPDSEDWDSADGYDATEWEKAMNGTLSELAEQGDSEGLKYIEAVNNVKGDSPTERGEPLVIIATHDHESLFERIFEESYRARVMFIDLVREKQLAKRSRSNTFIGEVFGNLEV